MSFSGDPCTDSVSLRSFQQLVGSRRDEHEQHTQPIATRSKNQIMSSSRREYSRSGGKDGRDSRRRRRSSTASTSSAMSVSMPSLNVTHKRVAVAVILSFCIVSIIDLHKLLSSTADYNGSRSEGRRSLLTSLYLEAHSTLLPWAHHHLVDVLETPDFEKETALFWVRLVIPLL